MQLKKTSLAYDIAQFIIDDGTDNSTSSNWHTDFDDVEKKFGIENLAENAELLEEIENELWGEIELLDVLVNIEDRVFDNVYGTIFCQNYIPFMQEELPEWGCIILVDRKNGKDSYSLIESLCPNLSIVTQATGQKDGQTFEKSKLEPHSCQRLEKQFGITDRYKLIAKIDRDTGMVAVEHNTGYFEYNELEQPMGYTISIEDATKLFQKAQDEIGKDLSHPPTQIRLDSAIPEYIEEHLHPEEPALSEEPNLSM